jgi:hypothetical protein
MHPQAQQTGTRTLHPRALGMARTERYDYARLRKPSGGRPNTLRRSLMMAMMLANVGEDADVPQISLSSLLT